MTDVIQLLPDSIANQIAAGEVVQRPASVVKELMENAVDADARQISVMIKDAGKTLVQVIDDGAGMTETDARMSLERHATSKIRKTEDLFRVTTMGFRGEALASIAAVSQMDIKTRTEDSDLGTALETEASRVKSQHPAACAKGTSVSVKNLFYNIPARRNFLKSNGVEMRHVVEEFQRIALSRPNISFSLYQNDLESYNLRKEKLSQRIVNLLGKNYREQLVTVDEETDHLSIKGYIGKPESARKTRGEQYFFVNNRYIRSGYMNHAVLNAYEGLIGSDYFPFYVLFITIDPAHIDVNVHPTKTEIKFADERSVYGVIRSAIRQALGAHNISPSIDFESDINFGKAHTRRFETIAERNYSRFSSTQPTRQDIEQWGQLYQNVLQRSVDDQPSEKGVEITFPSLTGATSPGASGAVVPGDNLDMVQNDFIFLLHGKYIVSQVKSGMILIDIMRAHERILYEKFQNQLQTHVSLTQQALFHQTVTLNPGDFALLQDIKKEVKALGFDFEDFGSNSIVINGYPSELTGINEKKLFEELLEQYKINKSELSLPKNENLARALAKRTAIRPGVKLTSEEMNALIDNLFACSTPNFAPDGQLIIFILDLNKIESFFT